MLLFRYLAGEVLKSLLAVTTVLLAIVVSLRLARQLAAVAQGDLAPDYLLLMLLYRIPGHLEMIVPMAFFIAVLLVGGRRAADSELVVMRASGIGSARLAAQVLGVALPVMLLVAWLSLSLAPAATAAYEQLSRDNAAARHLRVAVEGRFRVDADSGRVSYVEQLGEDGRSLHGVFIAQPQRNSAALSLVAAERGHFGYDSDDDIGGDVTGSRFRSLTLEEGVIHVGVPGDAGHQLVFFERYKQRLHPTASDPAHARLDALPSGQLLASALPAARAVLYWRLALVMLVPVAGLLALSLSDSGPRGGRFGRLLPALLLYLLYVVAINAVRDAAAVERVAAMPGLALAHLPFLVLALVLLFHPDIRHRWRRA